MSITRYAVYVDTDVYKNGGLKFEDIPGFIELDWEDLEYLD